MHEVWHPYAGNISQTNSHTFEGMAPLCNQGCILVCVAPSKRHAFILKHVGIWGLASMCKTCLTDWIVYCLVPSKLLVYIFVLFHDQMNRKLKVSLRTCKQDCNLFILSHQEMAGFSSKLLLGFEIRHPCAIKIGFWFAASHQHTC